MAVGPLIPQEPRSPLEIESDRITRLAHAEIRRQQIEAKNGPLAKLSARLMYRESPALLAMQPAFLNDPVEEIGANLIPLGEGMGVGTQGPCQSAKPANDK
jgi:hypothetical protein